MAWKYVESAARPSLSINGDRRAIAYIVDGMKSQYDDRRQHERFAVSVPVELPSAQGVTQNVSLSGVYFEAPVAIPEGTRIRFSLVLGSEGISLRLNCEGTVVRVTKSGRTVGIAAKVDDLECIPEPPADSERWH
jgi:PilZ domain